jgi:hypothetical protein
MKVSKLINFCFSTLYTIDFDYVIKINEVWMVWQDHDFRLSYRKYRKYIQQIIINDINLLVALLKFGG